MPPTNLPPLTAIQSMSLIESHAGMSLRDYFAAAALTGLCANHETLKKGTSWLVDHAFNAADAMLAFREQSKIENRDSKIQ